MLHGLLETRWRYPRSVTIMAELRNANVETAIAEAMALRNSHALEESASVHFVRIVALEAGSDLRGHVLPPRLLINGIFEGTPKTFYEELTAAFGQRLVDLLQNCTSFDASHSEDLPGWMRRNAIRPQTLHVGTLHDELKNIREENLLQIAIERFIDDQQCGRAWSGADPATIHRDILAYVRSRPDLTQSHRSARTLRSRIFQTLDLLGGIAFVSVPPILLACLIIYLRHMNWWSLFWLVPTVVLFGLTFVALTIRYFEITEGDLVVVPKTGQTRELVEDEDFGIQNQITLVVPVRDSGFRRLSIRIVLWVANSFSKHWYQRGQLAGIDTIHFARFHLIDGGRRMVFISDFDGGWERYLFDFLGVGSLAVVPIWSNLHGCPKARLLRFPLPGFAQRFLPFTRARQVRSHFNYSAVPDLTVTEIKRNADIRAGLFQVRDDAAIQRWLDLF